MPVPSEVSELKTKTRDMTHGEPARLILLFLLPILAGNILQEFYSLVDSYIIGQINGITALSAVSTSGWLDWLVLSISLGLTQGFSIQGAQDFGAGKKEGLKRTVGQSILVAAGSVVLIEAGAQLLLRPVVTLMQTPEEIFELEILYLRIIFAGTPLVMIVNFLSGFLRSVGNSRTPLIAMIFSTLTNAALDLIFVGLFRWGVAGAALATVIAQGVSCIVCFIAILHLPLLHPTKRDLIPDLPVLRKLIRTCSPLVLGNIVISIGGLVLQTVVNGFGYLFSAGYNTAGRLQGPIEIAGVAISSASGTFIAQNYGANNLARVREGFRKSLYIIIAACILIMTVIFVFGEHILLQFLRDDPAVVDQVLRYASRFLKVIGMGLPFLYLLFLYRSALQGLGDTFIPMLSGFLELFVRIICALLLPRLFGMNGVFYTEILAWGSAALLLIVGYYRRMHRLSADKRLK
ncbi:MAG: MATE family efflux transporter [Clostridia bacterium]|nr:MATE family efflux transporter [Clostridia bacterium]